MPTLSRPRHGSLQYWPRKRARKTLPRTNWKAIEEKNGNSKSLLGFIGYKVGMKTAFVKDNTEHSMSKDKRITVPCTIIELPPMKIFSIRTYNKGIIADEVISENIEKEMKKRLKLPKTEKKITLKKKFGGIEKGISEGRYDDVRVLVYSLVKRTKIKKKPDVMEIGIAGSSAQEKFTKIKELMNKEISITEIFDPEELVDTRGLTKGKGFSGPVKRYGIELRSHKSEKGVRKVGSIAPWHPARVTFRTPMAGQLGMFTRVMYNKKIIKQGEISKEDINPKEGFKTYGKISTEYLILSGSVQGSTKRPLIITKPLRPTKKQIKKKYEFIELR